MQTTTPSFGVPTSFSCSRQFKANTSTVFDYSFYVKDDYGCSGLKRQMSRIEARVPTFIISPYLFTLVITKASFARSLSWSCCLRERSDQEWVVGKGARFGIFLKATRRGTEFFWNACEEAFLIFLCSCKLRRLHDPKGANHHQILDQSCLGTCLN